KKLKVMVFAVAAAFPGLAAAQGSTGMIAYDHCFLSFSEDFLVCEVVLEAADKSKIALVPDGTDPTWSPDGSRIAFAGFSRPDLSRPGLFVLNLRDWSVANVRNSGQQPAWSHDGQKIAFSDAGELHVMNPDGSNVVQLTNSVGFIGRPAWSPDGST